MTTMTASKAVEIQKMVFIDSTWAQAKQIFKDPRLKGTVINSPSISRSFDYNKSKSDDKNLKKKVNTAQRTPWYCPNTLEIVIKRDRMLPTAKTNLT